MIQREKIISNYIHSYNNFDVNSMVANMDEDIKFENISGGKLNMSLNGIKEFKEQAEQAAKLFSKRKQAIQLFKHKQDHTEIEISYTATLAVDLPNGMKKGDDLNLTGRSIFKFSENKIIALTDMS